MATPMPTRTSRTCAPPDAREGAHHHHADAREGAHDHDACLDGLDQAVTAAVDDYLAAGGRIEDLTALHRS